jgi:CheY-like chemotaxis protein
MDVTNRHKRPTVLIVDDEPNLLEVRRIVLERFGYRAIAADSGRQALEIFKSTAVDAVILDYLMPDMDGGQTAREIRNLDREIPIILSSASVTVPGTAMEFFDDFVPKASDPRCLLETLKERLRRVCCSPKAAANAQISNPPEPHQGHKGTRRKKIAHQITAEKRKLRRGA